jgi:hypothetical protein
LQPEWGRRILDHRKKKERRLKRQRAQEHGRIQAAQRVQRVYEIVLSAFELWDEFRRLPRQDRQTVLELQYAKMKVDLGPSAQESPRAIQAREALLKRLRACRELPIRTSKGEVQRSLSIEEYVGVFPALTNLLSGLREWNATHNRSPDRARILGYYDQALSVIRTQLEANELAIRGLLYEVVDNMLIPFAPLEVMILWYEVALVEPPEGVPYQRFTIHERELERDVAQFNGIGRPITRFGCAIGPGLRLPSWPGNVLGDEKQREYPVYTQAHVIKQFRERVPLTEYERELRYSLLDSLEQPKLIAKPTGDYLVEFRFMGQLLGYFGAVKLADRVVLKTFLFLTMQGTPESEKLRKQLKLVRPDIEYICAWAS